MVFMQAMFLRFTISRKSRKKLGTKLGTIGLEKTPLLPDVLGELNIVKTDKKTATAVIVQNNYDMQVGNKIRSKR